MISCFCWPVAMEQSTGWHYTCFIIDSVSTKTENTFISAVISGHCVACLWLFSPSRYLQLFGDKVRQDVNKRSLLCKSQYANHSQWLKVTHTMYCKHMERTYKCEVSIRASRCANCQGILYNLKAQVGVFLRFLNEFSCTILFSAEKYAGAEREIKFSAISALVIKRTVVMQ